MDSELILRLYVLIGVPIGLTLFLILHRLNSKIEDTAIATKLAITTLTGCMTSELKDYTRELERNSRDHRALYTELQTVRKESEDKYMSILRQLPEAIAANQPRTSKE